MLQSARSVWRQSDQMPIVSHNVLVAICTERVEAKYDSWDEMLDSPVAICTERVEAKIV